jgi:hypothetical protein
LQRAALHAAHHREARALQRAVSRATSGIAQPGTLILITLAIALWVTINLTLPELGHGGARPVSLLAFKYDRVDHCSLPRGDDPHDPAARR